MANPTTSTKPESRTATGQRTEKTADLASQGMDKARQAASAVGQTVSGAAQTVGQKADDLTAAAGSGLKNLGETICENAPREGVFGDASQAVANTLREGGQYLEKEGITGVVDDLGNLVRNYPVSTVCAGVCIGFLLGLTLKS